MTISSLVKRDILEVIALWNQSCLEDEFLYEPIDETKFQTLFLNPLESWVKINLIYKHGDEVIGFVNGCYQDCSDTGYVTIIIVKAGYKRQGIGTQLLNALEAELEGVQSILKFDLIFFNPINLSWIVPNTTTHQHPNAPGVNVRSDAYPFFENNGYHDIIYQNTYYQTLHDFQTSPSILERQEKLRRQKIQVTYYQPEYHTGWKELFLDLNNSLWKQLITESMDKDPILIVEYEGKICGFTGPLRVEENKRGYFCGIGIHSNYRRYGFGKILFSALCVGLKELGAEYMTLFTGENNPARYIYESAQFKIVATWADMRKELNKDGR